VQTTRRFLAGSALSLSMALTSVSAPAQAADEPLAPSGSYQNDPTQTSLSWSILHMGLSNYTARLNDVSITLKFDGENPAASSVTAEIDPTSVDTGYPGETDFDGEIANDERFFNAGVFPAIRFESTGVEMTGEDRASITGDLSFLGVTRPVTIDARLIGTMAKHPFAGVPALGFEATTRLDRTDFGLDYLSGRGLGDEVEIVIQAEFLKAE